MQNIKKNKLFKYKIKNLELFGYHGLYSNEIENGQIFVINIDYCIYLDNDNIRTDKIDNLVDYTDVLKQVEKIFNDKRYNLLESLIEEMHKQLSKIYKFKKLDITILKKISGLSNLKLDGMEVGIKSE